MLARMCVTRALSREGVPHCGLPFGRIVLSLGELGDVGRRISEGEQLRAVGQFKQIIEWYGPSHQQLLIVCVWLLDPIEIPSATAIYAIRGCCVGISIAAFYCSAVIFRGGVYSEEAYMKCFLLSIAAVALIALVSRFRLQCFPLKLTQAK